MGNSFNKSYFRCCFCASSAVDSANAGLTRRRRHVAPALSSDPADDSLGHSFCYVRPSDVDPPDDATTFRAISGAAVSANASTPPLSASLVPDASAAAPAAFESSDSFASVLLQPAPRLPSGPLSGPLADRGFLSGPIERAFMSGPIDPALISAVADRPLAIAPAAALRRSLSQGGGRLRERAAAALRALTRTMAIVPKESSDSSNPTARNSIEASVASGGGVDGLQWAHGKAGEDRVHIVVSDERDWVFVGIYDGFNGPDATDFLVSNLYAAVHRELKGLLWDDNNEYEWQQLVPDAAVGSRPGLRRVRARNVPRKWDKEKGEEEGNQQVAVLKALARALRRTEEAFLRVTDEMVGENPELALMGSCVLVMLMKGDEMYAMNVGDSRAVLATQEEDPPAPAGGKPVGAAAHGDGLTSLSPVQLTMDHNTSNREEAARIRAEHPDDRAAIGSNGRVKGSLNVTRAFGAGFLKQPKWNNALLEAFRIEYIGSAPYISCIPSLRHRKLGPKDRFVILSSDGLYQYFSNEEAVAQVEMFVATTPDGDPAQHLAEEVLFRAATKAGMDFHELIEIPHGDRRRYHDDLSIIVISLEGRIWRSFV